MKFIFTIATMLLVLSSCHKQRVVLPEERELENTNMQQGLPSDLTEVHGYLFASDDRQNNSGQRSSQTFALFRDPGEALLEEYNHITRTVTNSLTFDHVVHVGDVQFNFQLLNNSGHGYMGGFNSPDTIAPVAVWHTEGNQTFKPLAENIPRGFPSIVDSLVVRDTVFVDSVSVYTFDLGRIASNYDSLSVTASSSFAGELRKCVPAGGGNIILTNEEIKVFAPYPTTFIIESYNYSNKMVDSKLQVFELATRLSYQAIFKSR